MRKFDGYKIVEYFENSSRKIIPNNKDIRKEIVKTAEIEKQL
jgi:hypothetical protein